MDKKQYVNGLLNRIWITRKCRINASERFDNLYFWTRFFQVYYSLILIVLSINNFSLIKEEKGNDSISLLLLVASLAVSFFSMYISSQNYKERALKLKYNYHGFDELYRNLDRIIINEDFKLSEVFLIEDKYLFLLKVSENHSTEDYLTYQKMDNKNDYWKFMDYLNYYWMVKRWYILFFLLFMWPIVLGIRILL